MQYRRLSIITLIGMLGISAFNSCSDSESRLHLPPLGQAVVTINPGLPAPATAMNISIIDRVMRFFTSDAAAAISTATFSSFTVSISGDGMTTIGRTFASTDRLSLAVPAGSARRIEVTAIPSSITAASFRGTAVVDIQAGQTVDVPVAMALHETKIVIPDHFNYRLIMIDDMAGTGWSTGDLGMAAYTLAPDDISFDSSGRIYVANDSTAPSVIRSDDINGGNKISFGPNSVMSVTVDRQRSILYYATATVLYRNNLDGTNQQQYMDISPITSIRSLEVAADGKLVIGGQASTTRALFLFNPTVNPATENGYLAQSSGGNLQNAYDLLVKGNEVYVANNAGGANQMIERFTIDTAANTITYADGYGNQTLLSSPPTPAGQFFGPRQFLGIRNDGLVIVDNGSGVARLVYMTDMAGLGWNVYGQWGYTAQGQGYFRCFSVC